MMPDNVAWLTRAEYEAAEWKDKYEAMLDLHAWESGVAQAQIDVTMAMAADAHTLNHVHHTRLQVGGEADRLALLVPP